MKYKIIVDSCGELTPEMKQDERFASAALTLEVGAILLWMMIPLIRQIF